MARHDQVDGRVGRPEADRYDGDPVAVPPALAPAAADESVTQAAVDAPGIGRERPPALHIPDVVGEIVSAPAFSIAPAGSLMLKRAVDVMVGLVGLVITVGLF